MRFSYNKLFIILAILSTLQFCLSPSNLKGQTVTIANKSRSSPTLNSNQLNQIYSNFGIAPQRFVQASKLDSLIFLNDSQTIMVTSRGSVTVPWRTDTSDFRGSREIGLWEPGRDTVLRHPHFNLAKKEAEIRQIIKDQYHFINSTDSVVFIYFIQPSSKKQKRKRKRKKKGLFVPIGLINNPGGLVLCLAFILSIFYSRKSWTVYRS